jgi:hypothetical protein
MPLTLVDTREVKKNVGAIHVGGKLSLLQRKCYNILLFNSYNNLLNRERHEIKIRDLCELAGFDSNNIDVLKATLLSLSKTSVVWNLLDHDDIEEWGVSSLLAEAVIRKGVCVYAYSPSLREKLYKPELYARINLSVMSKFSGSYALALYENTVRFRSIGTTGWREVDIWRSILGLEDGEYRQFKEFNKKVLKSAVAEVNATSDILLDMDFRRDGRRIGAIRFQIRDNPQLKIPFPQGEGVIEQVRENDPEKAAASPVHERLLSYGLSATQARQVFGEYDAGYINAVLDVVERDFKAGKVENLPAYAYAALRKDYRPKPAPREKALADAKAARKQQRDTAEQQKLREEQEAAAAAEALNAVLDSLQSPQRQALEQEFIAALTAGALPGATFLKEQYRLAGFDSIAVRSMFRNFARERLLPAA